MLGTLEFLLGPNFSAEQTKKFHHQGKEAVVFALLEMAERLADSRSLTACR